MRYSDARSIEKERSYERDDVRDDDEPCARTICLAALPVTRFDPASKDNFEEKPRGKQKTRKPVRHAHA